MEELLFFAKNLLIEEGEFELSYRVHGNVSDEVAEEISGNSKKLFRSWFKHQVIGGSRKEARKDFLYNLLRELRRPDLAEEYVQNCQVSYLQFLNKSVSIGIDILPFDSKVIKENDSVRGVLKTILTYLKISKSHHINSLIEYPIILDSFGENVLLGFVCFYLKRLERFDILKYLNKQFPLVRSVLETDAMDLMNQFITNVPFSIPKTNLTCYVSPCLPTRKGNVVFRRILSPGDLVRRGVFVEAQYRHHFQGLKQITVLDFDTKQVYTFTLYHRDKIPRKTDEDGKFKKLRNDTYFQRTAAFATKRSLRVDDELVLNLHKGIYTLYVNRKRFQGPIISVKPNQEYLVIFPTPNRGFKQFTLTTQQRSEENPTLSDTLNKTFADAMVKIYLENGGDLELVAESIESADLNFSRYGDTFFEVFFVGGRTRPGTTKSDEGERHTYSVIDCKPKHEAILPYILYLQKILCTRPFLVKNLENVMRRFLQSLEFFEENERKKLAIFSALTFSQKLYALPPETVVQPLLKDNLVEKGIVLTFITDFFKEYLIDNSVDDLVSLLKRGKMEDNLLVFFPSAKRSPEDFSEYFRKEGLTGLLEYNEEMIYEGKLKELKSLLSTQIAEETDVSEVIKTVEGTDLPNIQIVGILWDVIMEAVTWSGKTQQHNADSARCQVKTWAPLLNTFCTSRKLEFELVDKVQIQCYEDADLMELFPVLVRSLYEQGVLRKDTIVYWFNKESKSKGRQKFVKALEPFVNRLEKAEEEE